MMVDRDESSREAGEPDGGIGPCGWILTGSSYVLVLLTFPISLFFCIKVLQQHERAVIYRHGRLKPGGPKGPGIVFLLPCIESYTKVDLQTTPP
ncbi:stomatin-2-like [Amphiura filiformis]|uniref:stomatin-2-like n=1 Tax=Amphiura filiformis TaxID=82378 RepID=UPI003B21556F